MSVLHELLSVEADLEAERRTKHDKISADFESKPAQFLGQHRKLEMFHEDGIEYPEDIKKLDATVADKLVELKVVETRYFDALLQKEATNQEAVADLIVDGNTIAEKLPATFLLGMEKRLKVLKATYSKAPTLQLGIDWVEDKTIGKNIFKTANPVEKLKTESVVEPVVMYEATKEHPAQIKEVTKTQNVGKYVQTTWSGMLPESKKKITLARIEALIRACKQARQRANTTKIINKSIGDKLFSYIDF